MNFIKSVGIYQLFILQFVITIAEGNTNNESQPDALKNIQDELINKAKEFWEFIKKCLCAICKIIGIQNDSNCDQTYVAIPVTVVFFILVFTMICLVCCKCCCKKSCCKKSSSEEKESDDSNVDYDQFIMGADGQMYSQVYQGELMQAQMFPAEMMYPQMYQGQMFYPQMLQEGMQQSDVHNQEMQQTVTQEPKKKRKKKKNSSKHKNSNDDALLVGYDMM